MDVDGVGGGEMMRAMTHYVHGNLFPAPPGGHERHNPLRGRERDVAWTRGSASAAQPRAVCHNALGVGGRAQKGS